MSEYDDFEKQYAQGIDKKIAETFAVLDEKFPLQERVMRLEQIKADKDAAARRAELEQYAPAELPSLKQRLEGMGQEEGFRVESGFTKLDQAIGGFRAGNTYLVAGLEKSGKSSLLMDMLDFQLQQGNKVGYINTELRDSEFVDRMAAIRLNRPTSEIEADAKLREEWVTQTDGKLFYAGVQNPLDLKKDNVLSFERTMERMAEFATEGCKVLMLDNLTTYNTIADGKRKGWEVLASCINLVVGFAKERGIVLFVVIHTKPNLVYGETPTGVRNIINDDPKKIFSESVTVSRKPSLNDVYGGGGALSQLSGALMVWRPYQKFNMPKLTSMTMVTMDSFRHAPSGGQVYMEFEGEKSTFREAEFLNPEQMIMEALNK